MGRANSSIVTIAMLITILAGCKNSDRAADPNATVRSTRVELAHQDSNLIKTSWPSIGCWFWFKEEFEPEGYKRFIDLHEKYPPFELLTILKKVIAHLPKPMSYQLHRPGIHSKNLGSSTT